MGLFESKPKSATENQAPKQGEVTKPKEVKVKPEKKPRGLSQKDAVFIEVKKVMTSDKVQVAKGKAIGSYLTKEQRKVIVDALMEGFRSKKYPLKDTEGNRQKLADDKLLRAYVTGLLKNWLERDTRLQNQEGEFLQG